MKILRKIPMFAFVLVIYDLVALIGGVETLTKALFRIKMASGAVWVTTVGDLLIILGLIALFIEVFKSTRPTDAEIFDHILSTLVFIVFLLEFILLKAAMTSPFFILTLMSLFDVIAGFTISIKTAKRDISLDRTTNIPL